MAARPSRAPAPQTSMTQSSMTQPPTTQSLTPQTPAVQTPLIRTPTMTDVAELAGVSHQTVSRVLNDQPNVRSETRAKVLDAIRELGYRPNTAARQLVTRRSQTLGVVSFDTTLYGPASMLYGI